MKDSADADWRVDDFRADAGAKHEQRNVDGRLIQQVAMLRLVVIAEPFAMIPGNDDGRLSALLRAVLLERLDEATELLIHCRDLPEIGIPRKARAKRCGWSVR